MDRECVANSADVRIPLIEKLIPNSAFSLTRSQLFHVTITSPVTVYNWWRVQANVHGVLGDQGKFELLNFIFSP